MSDPLVCPNLVFCYNDYNYSLINLKIMIHEQTI
ncbi:hypothetical protein DCAR_0832748 [Daucus carota subsp. sativus]|uniref:Uncharacterized protein n=1 Tax=Daucus carota subsp. sativus TaxID=79200 RepID=A0AAF0XUV1_DAUCS|nr:hypothetical protein DCAR_0832748 [Daucus carota subsp. sativus]